MLLWNSWRATDPWNYTSSSRVSLFRSTVFCLKDECKLWKSCHYFAFLFIVIWKLMWRICRQLNSYYKYFYPWIYFVISYKYIISYFNNIFIISFEFSYNSLILIILSMSHHWIVKSPSSNPNLFDAIRMIYVYIYAVGNLIGNYYKKKKENSETTIGNFDLELISG